MELTPELVARFPRPGMALPGKIQYAPDSRSLTYLFSERGDLTRVLWRLDMTTGQRSVFLRPPGEGITDDNISPAEALRRERQRVLETGITDYAWAEKANVLLLPVRGDVYRWSKGALGQVAAGAIDPQISKDGRRVFFVREGELWCVDGEGERQLTVGAGPGVGNGVADYIAQEDLGRPTGYWPCRSGQLVAFAQVDERHIPVYPIVHQGADAVRVEEHRYPFAGQRNALVRLGVVDAGGGPARWLELGRDADLYLARVAWHPDGRLFVQLLSRSQQRLELRAYDPTNGESQCLLVEESDQGVNLHQDLSFVESTGEFVWSSERTGYRHLSLRDRSGKAVRELTRGSWPVDGVVALDKRGRNLYFAAGMDTPLERQIYRVALGGGEPVAVTSGPGMHQAVFAPDFFSFVHGFDSCSTPPTYRVRRMNGEVLHTLHPPASLDLDLPPPALHRFETSDETTLYAAVYRPKTPGKAPVIVSVYGGPTVSMVVNGWVETVDLRAQLLAAHGFVVLKVDNRGSARRGVAFEAAIAGNLGDLEIRDQVEGLRWLETLGFADITRAGIYGWSYGGYLAAMALLKAPEVFRVGVAGAPVTSWDGYETAYTERWMGTPQGNRDGYEESSVLRHAHRLRGKLLLIHGLLDENVHFRHTARFMNALIRANKPFDVLLYPNERHMPRSESDRVAMETRILEYFKQHL